MKVSLVFIFLFGGSEGIIMRDWLVGSIWSFMMKASSQNHIYEIQIGKSLGQGQRNARTDFRFFGCELNFLPTVKGKNRLLSYAMLVKSNFCTRFYLFGFSFRLFRFLVFSVVMYQKLNVRKKATEFIFSVWAFFV